MVAKTPPLAREKRFAAISLSPTPIRVTLEKVDRCVARLQEMQHTISSGKKVAGAINTGVSPRKIRGCQRATTHRLKNSSIQKSPPGKFPASATGEWCRMSLPAMLLGETLLEIRNATQLAKRVAAGTSASQPPPRTPPVMRRTRPALQREETPELRSRRAHEKQLLRRARRVEFGSPSSSSRPRVRNRKISFRHVMSPPQDGATHRHPVAAQRVSPKGSPWSLKKKKTAVLFPNATFDSSPRPAGAAKRMTMIPGIKRRSPPHKFLVKSPAANSKFQVKIESPSVASSKKNPIRSKRPQGLFASSPAAVLRRSFSPSRLASRLASPIKCRLSSVCRRKSWSSVVDSSATSASSRWSNTPVTECSTPERLLLTRRVRVG